MLMDEPDMRFNFRSLGASTTFQDKDPTSTTKHSRKQQNRNDKLNLSQRQQFQTFILLASRLLIKSPQSQNNRGSVHFSFSKQAVVLEAWKPLDPMESHRSHRIGVKEPKSESYWPCQKSTFPHYLFLRSVLL